MIGTFSYSPAKAVISAGKNQLLQHEYSPERRAIGYVTHIAKFFSGKTIDCFQMLLELKFLLKKEKSGPSRFEILNVCFLIYRVCAFNRPIHTGFPCILRTRNMMPTNKKNTGPRNPNNAIHFVP